MSKKLGAGSLVVAVRPGGQDMDGLPLRVPEPGQVYRLTGVYRMRYGLGCTIEGLDAYPYRGFFLYVRPGACICGAPLRSGWYFRPVKEDEVENKNTAWLGDLLQKHRPKVTEDV